MATAGLTLRSWASEVEFFIRRHREELAFSIVMLTFFARFYFIFFKTSYAESIWTDMSVYWNSADTAAWNTKNFYLVCRAGFPPLHMYYLALLMRLGDLLAITSHILVLTIFINLVVSTLAGYLLYRCARKVMRTETFAMALLLAYSLSYQNILMTSIVLPDNMSAMLFVYAVAMAMIAPRRIGIALITGLVLAYTLALKPLLVFSAGVFTLYYFFFTERRRRLAVTAAFVAGFMLMIGTIVVINYKMSNKEMLGISHNGGNTFFIAWGEHGRIYDSQGVWAYSPGTTARKPEWPTIHVPAPFRDQKTFYKLAMRHITEDPMVLLRKITWMQFMIESPLFPTLNTNPPGFDFMEAADVRIITTFFMLAFFLMALVLSRRIHNTYLLFPLALYLMHVLAVYILSMPERRYFYLAESLSYLLGIAAIERIVYYHRIIRRELMVFGACMTVLLFYGAYLYDFSKL